MEKFKPFVRGCIVTRLKGASLNCVNFIVPMKSEIVPVTNRNALPVERHMELPNLNDKEHIYLECIEDNFENL